MGRFIIPDHSRAGRPCPPERSRECLNAILYVLRTGCAAPTARLHHEVVRRARPRRSVVEETNGWINTAAESTATTKPTSPHKGFFILSKIAPLPRRLDRSQLFDTLYAGARACHRADPAGSVRTRSVHRVRAAAARRQQRVGVVPRHDDDLYAFG